MHSWNPGDPQYRFVERKWRSFIGLARRPLVVTESAVGSRRYKGRSDAIARGGDVGFIAYLARATGTMTACFEPTRRAERQYLEDRFNRREIIYYYFARVVAQWYRMNSTFRPDIIAYIDQYLHTVAPNPVSLEDVRAIHTELFGGKLDLGQSAWFRLVENPMASDNPLRSVVDASRCFRDETVSAALLRESEVYDLFVLYGSSHAKEFAKRLSAR